MVYIVWLAIYEKDEKMFETMKWRWSELSIQLIAAALTYTL